MPDTKYGYGEVNPVLAVTTTGDGGLAPTPSVRATPLPAPVAPKPASRHLQHLALALAFVLGALALVVVVAAAVLRRAGAGRPGRRTVGSKPGRVRRAARSSGADPARAVSGRPIPGGGGPPYAPGGGRRLRRRRPSTSATAPPSDQHDEHDQQRRHGVLLLPEPDVCAGVEADGRRPDAGSTVGLDGPGADEPDPAAVLDDPEGNAAGRSGRRSG